eukprot:gene15042-21113_t
MRIVQRNMGWKEVDDNDDWEVYWTDTSVSMERIIKLNKVQRSRTLTEFGALTASDWMAKNLLKMCCPDFLADVRARGKKQFYILKPDAGCQGRGIRLVQGGKEEKIQKVLSEMDGNTVAQHYLHKPHLIHGYKYDMRIYTLVLSCDPLRVFVYKEGLTRICTEKYCAPKSSNISVSYMHLTNYAVNKHNDNFVANEGNEDSIDEAASKWSLAQTGEYIKACGHDWDAVWLSIQEVIMKSIISVQPALKNNYRSALPPDNDGFSCFELLGNDIMLDNELALPPDNDGFSCFELLGYDIMLDSELRPWLIEVNHSASFNIESPLDLAIKSELVFDTLTLVRKAEKKSAAARILGLRIDKKPSPSTAGPNPSAGPSQPPASSIATDDRDSSGSAAVQGEGGPSAGGAAPNGGGTGGPSMGPDWKPKTVEEYEIWRAEVLRVREKYEAKHSGGYTRIYPSSNPLLQATYEELLKGANDIYSAAFSSRPKKAPVVPGANDISSAAFGSRPKKAPVVPGANDIYSAVFSSRPKKAPVVPGANDVYSAVFSSRPKTYPVVPEEQEPEIIKQGRAHVKAHRDRLAQQHAERQKMKEMAKEASMPSGAVVGPYYSYGGVYSAGGTYGVAVNEPLQGFGNGNGAHTPYNTPRNRNKACDNESVAVNGPLQGFGNGNGAHTPYNTPRNRNKACDSVAVNGPLQGFGNGNGAHTPYNTPRNRNEACDNESVAVNGPLQGFGNGNGAHTPYNTPRNRNKACDNESVAVNGPLQGFGNGNGAHTPYNTPRNRNKACDSVAVNGPLQGFGNGNGAHTPYNTPRNRNEACDNESVVPHGSEIWGESDASSDFSETWSCSSRPQSACGNLPAPPQMLPTTWSCSSRRQSASGNLPAPPQMLPTTWSCSSRPQSASGNLPAPLQMLPTEGSMLQRYMYEGHSSSHHSINGSGQIHSPQAGYAGSTSANAVLAFTTYSIHSPQAGVAGSTSANAALAFTTYSIHSPQAGVAGSTSANAALAFTTHSIHSPQAGAAGSTSASAALSGSTTPHSQFGYSTVSNRREGAAKGGLASPGYRFFPRVPFGGSCTQPLGSEGRPQTLQGVDANMWVNNKLQLQQLARGSGLTSPQDSLSLRRSVSHSNPSTSQSRSQGHMLLLSSHSYLHQGLKVSPQSTLTYPASPKGVLGQELAGLRLVSQPIGTLGSPGGNWDRGGRGSAMQYQSAQGTHGPGLYNRQASLKGANMVETIVLEPAPLPRLALKVQGLQTNFSNSLPQGFGSLVTPAGALPQQPAKHEHPVPPSRSNRQSMSTIPSKGRSSSQPHRPSQQLADHYTNTGGSRTYHTQPAVAEQLQLMPLQLPSLPQSRRSGGIPPPQQTSNNPGGREEYPLPTKRRTSEWVIPDPTAVIFHELQITPFAGRPGQGRESQVSSPSLTKHSSIAAFPPVPSQDPSRKGLRNRISGASYSPDGLASSIDYPAGLLIIAGGRGASSTTTTKRPPPSPPVGALSVGPLASGTRRVASAASHSHRRGSPTPCLKGSSLKSLSAGGWKHSTEAKEDSSEMRLASSASYTHGRGSPTASSSAHSSTGAPWQAASSLQKCSSPGGGRKVSNEAEEDSSDSDHSAELAGLGSSNQVALGSSNQPRTASSPSPTHGRPVQHPFIRAGTPSPGVSHPTGSTAPPGFFVRALTIPSAGAGGKAASSTSKTAAGPVRNRSAGVLYSAVHLTASVATRAWDNPGGANSALSTVGSARNSASARRRAAVLHASKRTAQPLQTQIYLSVSPMKVAQKDGK